MARVLVIDGEPRVCEDIAAALDKLGHVAVCHGGASGAVELAEKESCDLVILAHTLPDGRGTDLIPRLKLVTGHPEIIMLMADGDGDGNEIIGRYGAWDHVKKPLDDLQLGLSLMRALKYREHYLEKVRSVPMLGFAIAGSGREMKQTLELLLELSAKDKPVFIMGEKGTMKSVYARALHDCSARSENPFVSFDCMSLPVDLAQSMFAVSNSEGQTTFSRNMINKIGRGTLFMKNIEALPQPVYETLIRMQVEPGAKRRMGLDFRLVVSSTQDLRSLSDLGVFPKRLADVLIANTLRIPPLRRRKDDIPETAHRRSMDLAKKNDSDVKGMSAGFINALQDHDWPGNDAELSSVLEMVCAFSTRQPMLLKEHLPESLGGRMTDKASRNPIDMFPNYREFRENLLTGAERAYLLDVIEFSEGSHTKAEEITGLSRSRLYELLSKYGLTFKSVSRKKK